MVLDCQGDTCGDHRNDKSNVFVEGTRRYVAFVYLCETAHRHVAEGSNIIYVLRMTLCLFSRLPLTIDSGELFDCHLYVFPFL